MRRIGYWITDYLYLLRGQSNLFIYRRPPDHYLGHIVENKGPVLFIPGLLERWSFFAKIADKLSLLGHPVYVIPNLGQNLKDIPYSAKVISELIEQNKLQQVTVIAHSKGGLIGKYLLANYNKVKKLIAIATPFAGAKPAKYVPLYHFQELTPRSKVINDLISNKEVNKKIVSIYPIFDNHIWPQESPYLDGAKNIQVNIHGHHKVLFSEDVINKIVLLLEG